MSTTVCRWLFLLSLLPALFCPSAALGEQSWTEVRSPHFRVITDGSSRDARNIAYEFEQLRYLFTLHLKRDDIDSSAPLTIVAARDSDAYRELDPALWKSQGDRVAGFFFTGWEKQFALVRLDTWGDQNQVTVYHEYTHSILHANAHWLPTWLDEGIAEFYAYTRFERGHIYIGAPSMRLGVLRNRPLIPVSTMLDVNESSPYLHDEDREQRFYAESWAMVHYMVFGPGMGNGKKFDQFFTLIQNGAPQAKAFQEVFGDPHSFDDGLMQYLTRLALTAAVFPPQPGLDPKSFSERKLTPAETEYEIGSFRIGAHDYVDGRASIEKALALDPNLAAAHEELGFLNFDSGLDDAAEKEWKQAIALNPALARSTFALIMTGPLSGPVADLSPEQLQEVQRSLRHVTELNPKFAPAFVELALVEWQLRFLQQAYNDAHHAELLAPWRAGYHLLTGHILLHGNQPAMAATYARYVAGHWIRSDHDEAVDLWKAIPPAFRGDGPPLSMDSPPGAEIVRGRLVNISCSTPGTPATSITLQPDGPPGTKPLTFTSKGPFAIGFSDTLWWGEDHFSACHHLAGYPAVILYKPEEQQGGQVVEIEIRDNLPGKVAPSTQAAGVMRK